MANYILDMYSKNVCSEERLDLFVRAGYITQEQADKARADKKAALEAIASQN